MGWLSEDLSVPRIVDTRCVAVPTLQRRRVSCIDRTRGPTPATSAPPTRSGRTIVFVTGGRLQLASALGDDRVANPIGRPTTALV